MESGFGRRGMIILNFELLILNLKGNPAIDSSDMYSNSKINSSLFIKLLETQKGFHEVDFLKGISALVAPCNLTNNNDEWC